MAAPRPPIIPLSHSLTEVINGLLDPWIFILTSLSYLPTTILPLLRAGSFRTLLSWPRFQPLWFANFWSVAGPQSRNTAEPRVIPLLQGRVRSGVPVSADDAPSPGVGGVVLEVGPGSGMWVSLFSDEQKLPITHIYGIEPNASVHPPLRAAIAAAGLSEVYEIVPLGIQDLTTSGRVAEGSVDCIVSVFCLCSIPDPAQNIAALYRCLKPGGRWYVYEHVRVFPEQGWGMALYQAFVNLIWPHCIGGCELRRDTEKTLREAGPWSLVNLSQPPQEPWFHSLPHIYGILTK
ncbi:S-adenosyl-L-methionine-dependent methyltransferase [Lasiosphaeria hispida]|uniref:S-adenosyl-L-methionine-dependent methyltransferase n=1 Tax=Lasiosphaeria hispida TaxID=260671 RepID=A0AAJ0MH44_9PEZI|nr:S-adenosyl-L-methionine-dependent methyltransferase [Lasiosphaeria hispida]